MLFKRLPRKVRIKRKTFSVSYVPTIEEGKTAGTVDFGTKEIHVATERVDRTEVDSTILHEVLHAIANEYKFHLSEKMVLKLEKGLVSTFLKNGWRIVKD